MDETLADYFAALAVAEPVTALAVLDKALDAGVPRADLVRHVIGPAQNLVGQRWLEGFWGVADEHAATSIAEQILAVFAPPELALEAERTVWIACAEGEWHTFPPRLAAALASTPRLKLTALGGSISGEHLQRYLSKWQPDALGLSVTLTANLIGAARSIRAARRAGVPVIAGGAAWGEGQQRARKLGAQIFLADPADLVAAVDEVSARPGTAELPDIPEEVLLLERAPEELLRRAFERQCQSSPWMQNMNATQVQRTMEDFAWMARHAATAVLCEDATIVRDLFDWLLTLLTPRGVPGHTILDSALYLAERVQGVAPQAAAVLSEQALAAQAALDDTAEVNARG